MKDLKQSCNVFLDGKQYRAIKELGHRQDKPYSHLVREGVSLVLDKYSHNSQTIKNDTGDNR
ncbi:MAG: hypothetical protein ACE5KZ_15440 [Candidatus Scalinduaceae bacterium]